MLSSWTCFLFWSSDSLTNLELFGSYWCEDFQYIYNRFQGREEKISSNHAKCCISAHIWLLSCSRVTDSSLCADDLEYLRIMSRSHVASESNQKALLEAGFLLMFCVLQDTVNCVKMTSSISKDSLFSTTEIVINKYKEVINLLSDSCIIGFASICRGVLISCFCETNDKSIGGKDIHIPHASDTSDIEDYKKHLYLIDRTWSHFLFIIFRHSLLSGYTDHDISKLSLSDIANMLQQSERWNLFQSFHTIALAHATIQILPHKLKVDNIHRLNEDPYDKICHVDEYIFEILKRKYISSQTFCAEEYFLLNTPLQICTSAFVSDQYFFKEFDKAVLDYLPLSFISELQRRITDS